MASPPQITAWAVRRGVIGVFMRQIRRPVPCLLQVLAPNSAL